MDSSTPLHEAASGDESLSTLDDVEASSSRSSLVLTVNDGEEQEDSTDSAVGDKQPLPPSQVALSHSVSDSHNVGQRPVLSAQAKKARDKALREGEMLIKPTEMGEEELRSHMAEMKLQVEQEEAEVERRRRELRVSDIVISEGKLDKHIRSVFGFTVHCKCFINDEVRMTIWILLVVGVLAGIGFFFAQVDYGMSAGSLQLQERYVAITVSAFFSFLASILSFVQIRAHLKHWVHPPSQRCVVKILLMVPVYATSAWLSLVFLQWSLYIDFARTCYEALVIYQFMILLTKYLGGQAGVVEWLKHKRPQKWPFPLNCLPPVQPNGRFITYLKYGCLQYAVISPFVSVIAMALNTLGVYGDGNVDWTQGYVYVAIVQNCTQLTSLYCLVWLYMAMSNELKPFKPMAKFLVVKSVVFFTFWQAIGLAVLVKLGYLTSTNDLDVGQVQIGLQDFIICIEMFIAAAVHKYTFGAETYADGSMKLLMDQRQMFLAKLSYDRAVAKMQAAQAKALEEERAKLGITFKGKSLNRTLDDKRWFADNDIPDSSASCQDSIPSLHEHEFGDDDDDSDVEDWISQSTGVKDKDSEEEPLAASDGVELTVMPVKYRHKPIMEQVEHNRRSSNSALLAIGAATMHVARGAKQMMIPVNKVTNMIGLTNDNDEALIEDVWDDVDASAAQNLVITEEMRLEARAQALREKEEQDTRRKNRRSQKMKVGNLSLSSFVLSPAQPLNELGEQEQHQPLDEIEDVPDPSRRGFFSRIRKHQPVPQNEEGL